MKKSIKNNFLYNMWTQILNIILPLVTAPYVTRVLGANLLGEYSKTHAIANYFYLFTLLGLNNYGNRTIAKVRDDRVKASKTFWEIYFFQFSISIVVIIVYISYCLFLSHENKLLSLIQGLYVLSGLFEINWFCYGLEEFKLTSIRTTITRLLSATLVFLLVKSKSDFYLYTIIISGNFMVSAISLWPFARKMVDYIKPTWEGIKKHIVPNFILFWPIVAISMYNIMDKIILGYLSTNEEVAIYTYAERIVVLPTTLILALDNVVMPRMSNIFSKGNDKKAKELMGYVMLFAMFMSSAMTFGLAGISDVFAPWFYGDEFAKCGYYIFLLTPTILFRGWASALRTQFIIPTGRDKIYIISLSIGAVANLILDVLLIPYLDGIGAIIGTIVAEFLVTFIQFYACRKYIPIVDYMKDALSFGIIGLLMFIAIKPIESLSINPFCIIIFQILTGAVVYVLIGGLYMLKIKKQSVLINETLKTLKIKKQF